MSVKMARRSAHPLKMSGRHPYCVHESEQRGPISFVLPYPPSANRYWRHIAVNGRPRTLVSREARDYASRISALFVLLRPLHGPLRFTAHAYRPRKIGDLKNIEKVLADALNGIAYQDDSQIVESHWYRHDDKTNPRVEVLIESIGQPVLE